MFSGRNFKKIIKELGLTQEEAAKRLGKSRATIITWIGKADLDDEVISLIEKKLSIDVSNFSESPLQQQYSLDDEVAEVNQRNKKKSAGLIPFYNADFIAGNAELYYEDETIYPEYYMDVPEFSGTTAFRAYGDSMEPRIKSGNILFGTKKENWMRSLEYGQIYGITCKDGSRYLKYIRKHPESKEMLLLKSENKEYDDMDLYKDDIKNIWLINGWIDKRT